MFDDASVEGLNLIGGGSAYSDVDAAFANASSAAQFIDVVDSAITTVAQRQSSAGAYNSRLESVLESLAVRNENLTSAYSTVMDADVATETSNYIKQQLLQQTASTMLIQAQQLNATMALSLINSL